MGFLNKDDTKLTDTSKVIETLTNEINELRSLNARLSSILDFSMDMICTVDEAGVFISVSEASYHILGYKPHELIGRLQSDFTYHEDIERTQHARQMVSQGLKLTNFENRYVHKNGNIVPLVWSSRWVPEEKLRYGIARNATEKIRAEESLKASEKKYKDLFENNPAPMIIWDFKTFDIVDCNKEALIKYGYDREEFLQLNIRDITPVDDLQLIEDFSFNEQEVGMKHKKTWRHLKKNGNEIIVDITGHLIQYNGRRCVIGMLNDVTEKVILQESLEKQRLALVVSNKELEQFAYIASHDLQEPLRMVTGFVSLLMKKYSDKLDDTAKSYINYAVDGADRMRVLISDLLEYSRAGIKEDQIIAIDLNDMVNDLFSLYKNQIDHNTIKIETEHLPVINGHRAPIRQVFQNLISNAIKYRRSDIPALIQIRCEEEVNCWNFSISDNGIGISREYHEKIFVIFQRLHSKHEYSGTGIGLAMTKKILESLGGKIWLTSTLNEGSTFFFTIPK